MSLNLIAQNKPLQDICQCILNSHELPIEQNFDEENLPLEEHVDGLNFVDSPEVRNKGTGFKFKMQDIDQIERGVHCTKGKTFLFLMQISSKSGFTTVLVFV